jgi:hypothetical protein
MGDFGYKPHIHLLDQQLTLDPDIVAMMNEIEAQMATRRILMDMQRPNWNLLLPDFQSIVSTPSSNIFSTPTPAARRRYGPRREARARQLRVPASFPTLQARSISSRQSNG